MTYGFFFYWFSWLLWGITTFFMKKDTLRLAFSKLILVCIILSNISFSVGEYTIFFPFFLLLVITLFLFVIFSKSVYGFFCSFILMIGYTAMLFWKHHIAMYVFLPDIFLLPLTCFIFIFFMTKGLYNRIIISMLGTAGGELLHGLILSSYHLPESIGSQDYFVILYMILLCQLIIVMLKQIQTKLYTLLKGKLILIVKASNFC